MIGSFLSRTLILLFGYAYPAYECFKTVENTKPEIHQLLYWILVSIITICERLGDCLISWLPMYNEAKLVLFVYLWHHKIRGTLYVYDSFIGPIVKKHEKEIDKCLLELRIRGGEIAFLYWEKAATYGHTKFLQILQYASSQSAFSQPRSSQLQPKAKIDNVSNTEPSSQQIATEKRQPKVTTDERNVFEPKQKGNLDVSHHQKSKHSRFRFFKN